MRHIWTRRASLLFPAAVWSQARDPGLDVFFAAASGSGEQSASAVRELERHWRPGLACMILDLLRLPLPPDHPTRRRLTGLLERLTRQSFGADIHAWQQWMWKLPYEPHAEYGAFKGMVYENMDQRMRQFFPPGVKSRIRLDQVDWGGVRVNGIPPLVNPATLAASEAKYLKDDHVVFGLAWRGESRAYPKRILAWHEMARDRVGGEDFAIVYCTLCGTVIPYRATAGQRRFTLGTSGLLYESSKLMFDEETLSLWPALEGRPGVGPLTAEPTLQLELAPVVTTTWGEWRRLHPETRVLSLQTGHQRDYGEGAAYREYFGTDDLMFPVSRRDRRLRSKDEVLVVRRNPPLAFAVRLLAARPVLMHDGLVVLTSSGGGANRVYDASDATFVRWSGPAEVVDSAGAKWQVTEDALAGERKLPRVPAHRAFWFGWYAQFPQTVLIK